MKDKVDILVHLHRLEGKLSISNNRELIRSVYQSVRGEELQDETLNEYRIYLCGVINGLRLSLGKEPFQGTGEIIDESMFTI